MSTENNKKIIRSYLDSLTQRDATVIDRIFSPQAIIHSTMGDLDPIQFKSALSGLFADFPDIKYTLDDIISEENKVALRYSSIATHANSYLGVPATGKKIKEIGMGIYKFADDKVSEVWLLTDNLGVMQQLGVIPEASPKK